MEGITIILVAVGLSMDAVAVAVCLGITRKTMNIYNAITIASWFGGFQALMPLAGWLVGLSLRELIAGIDHWVAFLFLSFIGAKMIYESLFGKGKDIPADSLNLGNLVLLSIATSIDALAVGISFALIDVPIATPVIIIGSVTFTLSLIGVYVGKRVGRLFAKRVGIVGGVILIAIGTKILVEHLGIFS